MMNSQQLQYTKKMEKQRRRVHELEEKDAQMRLAVHQRKQFLAKVRETERGPLSSTNSRALDRRRFRAPSASARAGGGGKDHAKSGQIAAHTPDSISRRARSNSTRAARTTSR